jgi:hypothetical protein
MYECGYFLCLTTVLCTHKPYIGLTKICLSYYLHVLHFCDVYHAFQFPNPLTKRDLNIEPTGVSRGEHSYHHSGLI